MSPGHTSKQPYRQQYSTKTIYCEPFQADKADVRTVFPNGFPLSLPRLDALFVSTFHVKTTKEHFPYEMLYIVTLFCC